MKSPIPQDLRGKTLSNLIVVCSGVVLTITLLHLGQLWGALMKLIHSVMPFLCGKKHFIHVYKHLVFPPFPAGLTIPCGSFPPVRPAASVRSVNHK